MKPKLIALCLFALLNSLEIASLQAASFDCSEVSERAEKLVCSIPKISMLDDELSRKYDDVLTKVGAEGKEALIAEQKHWLSHTRNVCENENCLKHAYWSRKAELDTFFVKKSPLYRHEEEKKKLIKQVLAMTTLYGSTNTSFCRQAYSDLKKMNEIKFVDPIVQVQSYEDPALDPWKNHCPNMAPLHFHYWCEKNIDPDDVREEMELCHATYGLPPFKLFKLPPLRKKEQERYIFYTDSAYGPMNRDPNEPKIGGGFFGFHEVDFSHCNVFAENGLVHPGADPQGGKNYNSVINYKERYYSLVLGNKFGGYWLEIESIDGNKECSWSSVDLHREKIKIND